MGILMEILFGFAVVAVVLGGAVCGIIAVLDLRELKQRLSRLERELGPLLLRQNQEQMRAASSPEEPSIPPATTDEPFEPEPMTPPIPTPLTTQEPTPPAQPPLVASAPPAAERPTQSTGTLRDQWSSFEVTIGAKWLNWVGMILVIIGVMFFLKYAYDNQWIGP